MMLAPAAARVVVTVVAVLVALALAGLLSARLGGSPARVAVLRLVVGGGLGLALTYAIGRLFGTALG
jgi:VIT1/CCC1 family predicted Fe2+/Mn2+ transporter